MAAHTLEGGFAAPPIDAAHAFRSALTALSQPGAIQTVKGAEPPAPLSVAAGVLALTLCDHETAVWLAPSLATSNVEEWLRFHTGAPLSERGDAMFAFGRWEDMAPVTDFRIGSPDYPDRSATVVVEVPDLGTDQILTGPGISGAARLTVPDPAAFRANAALFPLGVDFFLTCGDRLAGLPRTTRIGG